MDRRRLLLLGGAAVAASVVPGPLSAAARRAWGAYPPTPIEPVVDSYGGVDVADPYRWLEADIRTSSRVADWVAAQNRVSRPCLAGLEGRSAIAARIDALDEIERIGLPQAAGERLFYTRRLAGAEQASLWMREGETGTPRRVLDPADWSDRGDVALADFVVSRDGRHVAYAVQTAGSDWRVWKVLDLDAGRTLSDEIRWTKYAGVFWAPDGTGFYYTGFPAPDPQALYLAGNRNLQLRFHRLGDPQAEDRLVYADPENPDWLFVGRLSQGRFLVINTGYAGGGAQLLWKDLSVEGSDFTPVQFGVFQPLTGNRFVGSVGSRLLVMTNVEAPNWRLVSIDADRPQDPPVEILAEGDQPLVSVRLLGKRLYACRLNDGEYRLTIHEAEGALTGEIVLPGAGRLRGPAPGRHDDEIFYQFCGYAQPYTTYRHDVTRGVSEVIDRPAGPIASGDYVVERVMAETRAGRLPVFLGYRRGAIVPGDTPLILYGYGGFGDWYPPDFSPEQVTWMDMGGIFAIAALPGDGAYGEALHRAGMLENKPAVFDAFNDCAEHLIKAGYTRPERMAAFGYSNGGLLVGGAVARRPDLYAAAMPTVGVLDMLRFPAFTNGRLWIREYGDPQDPAMFPILHGYSPYHAVVAGQTYPALLIGTGDTDDRVSPTHSFKYAARMQALADPSRPVLLSVEMDAGHGAGNSRSKTAAAAADRLAFAAWRLGLSRIDRALAAAGRPSPGSPLPRR